jgi:signal transduction histidine kinase
LFSLRVNKLANQTEDGNEFDGWLTPLMTSFLKHIKTETVNEFAKELMSIIHKLVDGEYFFSNLNRVLAWLRMNLDSYLPEYKHRVIDLLCDRAQLIIASETEKVAAKRQNDWERFHSLLHEMETEVVNICELEDLIGFFSTYLPRFDIPACYVALFKEHRPYQYRRAAPLLSTLIFAFKNNEIITAHNGDLSFPSSELIPDGLLPADESFTAVVESLYSRKEQIGFVVFRMGPRNGKLYNNLRYLISNAVEQVLLFETEQKTEQALANYTLELARANTELVRSNKELEFFAYAASHDLLEPLRMVKSYLELLDKRSHHKLDKTELEFMGFALNGAERMQLMIGDLLAYARVTTQSKPFEVFDCGELLQEVLGTLKVTIEEQGAVITYTDLPVLSADKKQLGHVFQNLIANAIKFRSASPPCIHVKACYKEREWEFAVSDNGIGIPAAHCERIFMIFQRVHSRHEYKGTGIGLAICKKIIEQHNGRIWVSSEVGKGSTFYFTLPDRL